MPDRFDDKPLRCSFCGREKPKQIRELIAGPGVHICADCVNLCNQILEGKQQRSREAEAVPDASEERLEKLIDMSRSLGDPEYDYIILGEGNTSAGADDGRESGSFYVKASGTSLRGIDEDGFVRVSREKARELLSADSLTDEQVAEGLIAASIDADGVRPSVETFLHALLLDLPGIEFVGHTHPTPVNALLCSQEPQEAIKGRLFPDEVVCCGPESAWVPYTDPGLPLAKAVGEAVDGFIDRWNEPPKIIMMQSHGMIAMGATPAQVLAATAMAVKAARVRLGAAGWGGIRPLTETELERIYTRPDEAYRQERLARE